MRIARNRGYGQNLVGRIGTFITPHPSLPGKIGRFTLPPTELVEDDQKVPDFIANTVWEDLEIVCPVPDVPIPAPSMPPKKTKKVLRKKKKISSPAATSPGADETTSI